MITFISENTLTYLKVKHNAFQIYLSEYKGEYELIIDYNDNLSNNQEGLLYKTKYRFECKMAFEYITEQLTSDEFSYTQGVITIPEDITSDGINSDTDK